MEKENAVIELVEKKSVKTRLSQAVVVALAYVLTTAAHAAASIDASGLTDEIDGSKSTIITLFGAGLVLLGIFAGWRYMKRGANSA